jgi:Penicillin-insensitive murein endopeptidase
LSSCSERARPQLHARYTIFLRRTAQGVGERSLFMSWSRGELWLDAELWLPEGPGAPVLAGVLVPSLPSEPPGLAASRGRRVAWKQRRHARRARASVIALSPVVTFMLAGLRADAGRRASFAVEDPPSLTFRFEDGVVALTERPARPPAQERRKVAHVPRKFARVHAFPKIEWHHARSLGLPYGGRLVDGTQLPVKGPDWVTWNPITDSVPNLPKRLYANEHTIRTILSVTHAYRVAHPYAARVVIGDISRDTGGPMDDHLSHQNGLDVDVYFPRVDRYLSAPTASRQIDRRLAQDLLDRFVAAGAQMIFVSPSTGLHGPAHVVMPWPGHDYHMHVRFPPPGG